MNISNRPQIDKSRKLIKYSKALDNYPEGTSEQIIKYVRNIESEYSHLQNITIDADYSYGDICGYSVNGFIFESTNEHMERVRDETDMQTAWDLDYKKYTEKEIIKKQEDINLKLTQYEKLRSELMDKGLI